jgi:transposase
MRRLRETGSVAPGKMGGHKPRAISGEYRVWLLQRIKDGDFTLRGLVAELGAR